MARLTQDEWKLIRHYLAPFARFNGIKQLLAKVEDQIVEGESDYIKIVHFEFAEESGADDLPGEVEVVRRLMGYGCRVLERDPPWYAVQVPHDGDGFNDTIDLLESLHNADRIRYRR